MVTQSQMFIMVYQSHKPELNNYLMLTLLKQRLK
ncbi:hypothetical protein CPT_Muenster_224 [Klebsiella phage Muenster]|nr:hypothetical protein CPT_Muenster_224 [Klebsiella phage Muenster]